MEVITGLWDSWGDDALVMDKEAGVFADPRPCAATGLRRALVPVSRAADGAARSARIPPL